MFTIQSTLTDEEKWYFDLHGFLVLQNVLCKDEIDEMLDILQHWLTIDESDIPAPLHRGRQETCKTHIGHIQYGHQLFQDLAMNPDIIRVVAGLMMNAPRLFHNNFTMMTKHDYPQRFHRDDSGFKFPPDFSNPHNDYQAGGGQIYCNHIATWVALVDVPLGTGFCLVPVAINPNFKHQNIYLSNTIRLPQLLYLCKRVMLLSFQRICSTMQAHGQRIIRV